MTRKGKNLHHIILNLWSNHGCNKSKRGKKGDTGTAGMKEGAKGEPGESIAAPTVAVSPAKMTVNESKTALGGSMFGRVVAGSVFIALFILLAQPQPAEKYSGLPLNTPCNGWNSSGSNICKNSTDNSKILSCSSSIHLGEGLNIHRSIFCHQLFPLFVKSNLNHSWRTSMLIGSGSCSGSLKIKIKIKRHKRPCPYYANTVATLHVVLDVSDLVFKLNPGPGNNRIATIISSRSSTNYRCRSQVKGVNHENLRSLKRANDESKKYYIL